MPHVDSPQSRCLASVQRADITPPVGIYHRMWGAATHDRSTGVHRPLTATVVLLRSGTNPADQQAMIGVDHCLFWPAEMDALLDSVSRDSGVERGQLKVFFSHTHGAGLMGLERESLPGGDLIAPYLKQLAQTITNLLKAALQDLQPATIVHGRGRCDLATHRDYFDEAAGRYVCGFNPAGEADETVVVSRITADTQQVLGTIVNYACHPTTLAWDNTLISPDYVGAMREVVETATAAPCLFLQGASGDIGPREGFVGDPAVADRNGRRLGYAALGAIEALSPPGQSLTYTGAVVSGATIGTWQHQPYQPSRVADLEIWQSGREVVSLPYRRDLRRSDELQQEHAHWNAVEQQARQAGDSTAARDARAMIERCMRYLTRVASLPSGSTYQYPIDGWRVGDAVWLAFDGEHYNLLQRTLRERFSSIALIIGTIANGSRAWYLPDASSYGKGLYQEEVSIFEQGCLEQVIEGATRLAERLMGSR